MALVLELKRLALTNVDDPAGRWQFEGGQVFQKTEHVANYASVKRVTFHGTDQNGPEHGERNDYTFLPWSNQSAA